MSSMSEHEDKFENNDGHDLAVEEARPKIKQPPLYRVVLINDDYTPMEFVVDILESIFAMERTRATQVMLEVHTKGKGNCGVFNFEIATAPASIVVYDGRVLSFPAMVINRC
jgi:ATP-dependent Clp protease adaptor protein ClpS